jgi:hypothetical protein
MNKPIFEFKDFSIEEVYEFLNIYKSESEVFSSEYGLDVKNFQNLIDQIKDSLKSGKKFKAFPRKSSLASQYCFDLSEYVDSERKKLEKEKNRILSKRGQKIAEEKKKASAELQREKNKEKLSEILREFEEGYKYPSINYDMKLLLGDLRDKGTKEYFSNLYEKFIGQRSLTLDENYDFDNVIYPKLIQYYTIMETDKILIENGMSDYGLYEVRRTTHPNISKGVNFYSFDSNDNLLIMAPPYQVLNSKGSNYIVFDSKLYDKNRLVVIPKSEIISYKLYGAELMQSTVSTNSRPSEVRVVDSTLPSNYQRPSISGTFFSSLLFGSTYTLLNGVGKALHNQTNILGDKLDSLGGKLDNVVDAINSISITTDHKIIDTSRVQIVLTDRRDLEIDGINIFYDLNRVYPNLDSLKTPPIKEVEHKSIPESSSNIADEVLKLKQLLDQGVIDEEEFKAMKKKLIS